MFYFDAKVRVNSFCSAFDLSICIETNMYPRSNKLCYFKPNNHSINTTCAPTSFTAQIDLEHSLKLFTRLISRDCDNGDCPSHSLKITKNYTSKCPRPHEVAGDLAIFRAPKEAGGVHSGMCTEDGKMHCHLIVSERNAHKPTNQQWSVTGKATSLIIGQHI